MTRAEAIEVVEMVVNSWPGPAWEADRLEAYVNAIISLDAAVTVRALSHAVQKLKYRPSVAELREFVQIERRLSDDQVLEYILPEKPFRPDWVHRWYRARAAGDWRPFPEQLNALDVLARQSPEHYRVYAPPEAPLTDPEFWIQEGEYLPTGTL